MVAVDQIWRLLRCVHYYVVIVLRLLVGESSRGAEFSAKFEVVLGTLPSDASIARIVRLHRRLDFNLRCRMVVRSLTK